MESRAALEHRAQVEEFRRKHRIGLLTLLFTDIVGSTHLKQHWGDAEALAMIHRHHALVRDVLAGFTEAEEITTAGDSFFLVFAKPSDSVKFSLLMQAKLRVQARETGHPLFDRIGIHVGEVFIEEAGASPKPKDLYGIQVDTCARILSLAKQDQILMSRFTFDNARQVLKGQDLEGVGTLSWLNHGAYLVKGVEEPIEVCEVGEVGQSGLTPPLNSEKAQRCLSGDGEPVLGWRPAVSQVVPGTNWVLQEKLGEGGFGEVWLGRHEILKESKVFKFCFRADRVRSLKREVTLFRLLKERVGNHPNIMGVHEVYFDKPPYYIVMDYAEGKDLPLWATAHGGLNRLPLALRLEIVAQAAEGLAVAHEAGVIHRDVKPSNLLVFESSQVPDKVQVKLTDFGVGQVVSAEALEGVTRMGFTQTMLSAGSSRTGTLLYMAPEVIAGKPASPQSDIYSLGVLFYQIIVGDFSRPLTMDWVKNIDDILIQNDLIKCFAGNPQDRFSRAGDLAKNLREMENRRAAQTAKALQAEAAKKRTYLFGLMRQAALGLLAIAVLVIGSNLFREYRAANYGSMEITTFPEGAEVWLNGQRTGRTPYIASKLSPGEFSYLLRLVNHKPLEYKAVVKAKKQTTLVAFMEPSSTSTPNLDTSYKTNTLVISKAQLDGVPFGKIVSINGSVEVLRSGTTIWILTSSTNQTLYPGDELRTPKGCRAIIQWSDYSIFALPEESSMQLEKDPATGSKQKPRIRVITRGATEGVTG